MQALFCISVLSFLGCAGLVASAAARGAPAEQAAFLILMLALTALQVVTAVYLMRRQ